MCHNPRHLVSLTLNHLDAILGYLTAASVKVNHQCLPKPPSHKARTQDENSLVVKQEFNLRQMLSWHSSTLSTTTPRWTLLNCSPSGKVPQPQKSFKKPPSSSQAQHPELPARYPRPRLCFPAGRRPAQRREVCEGTNHHDLPWH